MHRILLGMIMTLFISQLSAQTLPKPIKRDVADSTSVHLDESWEPLAGDSLVDDFVSEMEDGLKPDELDVLFIKSELNGEKEAEMVPGFRVQLIATRDEQTARQVRADALLNLPHNVYLIYDNPYYKIRVGDCLSHMEADSLQRLAILRGFVGAWIVRTIVNVNPNRERVRHLLPADSTAVRD